METSSVSIDRHKTAIRRSGFSVPVNCLLRDRLLHPDVTFFDYGCGRGQDLDLLAGLAIQGEGWDPAHRPNAKQQSADVVNLGYVINVIENRTERAEALRRAWGLSQKLLVVSAQLENDLSGQNHSAFEDGFVSSRNTFQKYFSQAELGAYIDGTLDVESIPAAPGVFFVFRSEEEKQQYLVRRYKAAVAVPRKRASELLFDQNRELMEEFINALTQLGRVPEADEFSRAAEVVDKLGSLKRAFTIVKRVTEEPPWEAIAAQRRDDLLVYLALSRFGRRPAFSKLPSGTRRDVKAFEGTYSRACKEADDLLFSVADAGLIDRACQRSEVGQLIENGLLVQRSQLVQLEPVLRTYEGCARALVGEVEEADVIKLHRFSGKITYLIHMNCQTTEAQVLRTRIKVGLRDRSIRFV